MSKQVAPSDKAKRISRQERTDTIVDAALAVFSTNGFRGATTRELARAAGVTEVTLFRHFPSKEKLYAAVLDKYSILPVLRSEIMEHARTDDARSLLRRLGRRFLHILKERQDMIRLILSEAVTNREQARMLFRQGPGRFIQDTAKVLAILKERGEVRDLDPEVAAGGILGAFFTFVLTREILSGKQHSDRELDRVADELGDLLWRGIRADGAGEKGGRRP